MFCRSWGKCHKGLWCILTVAVLGVRSLVLGFGGGHSWPAQEMWLGWRSTGAHTEDADEEVSV